MVRMALKGYTASQLSFHMASVYLLHELRLPAVCVTGHGSRGVSLSWTNRQSSSSYPPAENLPKVHQKPNHRSMRRETWKTMPVGLRGDFRASDWGH